MRKIAIIQARMNSSRLPGKILLPLAGKPVLWHIAETMDMAKAVGAIDDYIIATTTNSLDDKIESWCENEKICCFRGSEDDVLGRVYEAAKSMKADVIVDTTADCPLVDWRQIKEMGEIYDKHPYNRGECRPYFYISNCRERSWPDGFDIQFFDIGCLRMLIEEKMVSLLRRSHSGWNIPKYLKDDICIVDYVAKDRYRFPSWGVTLDTKEDYKLLSILFDRGLGGKSAEEIIDYLKLHRELLKINSSVVRKVPGDD